MRRSIAKEDWWPVLRADRAEQSRQFAAVQAELRKLHDVVVDE